MFNRILSVLASSGGDFFALLFALLTVYASFSAGEPEAYVFPRLVSVLMLIFCGLNFVYRVMANFAGEPKLTLPLINKIAPGVAVIVAYLLLAEDVGFYLSAALAFLPCLFIRQKTALVVCGGCDRHGDCRAVFDVFHCIKSSSAERVFFITA